MKARFFVGSDTHIGRSGAQEKVANALDVFYQVDPQADGVLLVGDLTDGGTVAQYDTLMNTINNSPMAGKVYMSMGNHDHYSGGTSRFEEKTGQKASDVLTFGDVTVVKLNPSISGYNYTNDYDLPYTNDRAASSKAPSFAEGAAVTVENVTGDSMIVKFPAAAEASGANVDMIHEYQITLTDSEGG